MHNPTAGNLNGVHRRGQRRGGMAMIVAAALGLVAIVGVGLVLLRGGGTESSTQGGETFQVRRGSFDITIPASGELAALRQIEIRNKLESKAIITYIAPEGVNVQAGDVLIRLADDEITNKIKDAEDTVNTANSGLIAAESTLAIRLSEGESEMEKAEVAVRMAELAYRAWLEGADVSKRKQLALAIETADINHKRLVERFEASRKLVEKEFISRDEFKQDEIAMIEAAAKLEQARLDIKVYEDYQREHDEAEKKSAVDQAIAERERVKQRHAAELETVRAEVASKKHQLASAQVRLADQQEQLRRCTTKAPSAGLVVYASSLDMNGWGRSDGSIPMAGTELHPNELVMVLPDTSQILANVKVNEALSGLIKPGQRAIVRSDAMPDTTLEGEVQGIGVLAETGGWRDPNRRDYTVRILLTGGNVVGLKPSMRARSDIYVGQVDNALYAPVQAIFRDGATTFVYVPEGGGYAQRAVTLGEASEIFIAILEGVREDETVLLREPAAREVVARLKETEPGRRDAPSDDPRPPGRERDMKAVRQPDAEKPDHETSLPKPGVEGSQPSAAPPSADAGDQGAPATAAAAEPAAVAESPATTVVDAASAPAPAGVTSSSQ